jgi:uncharacterized protein YqgC (DUF456 family)
MVWLYYLLLLVLLFCGLLINILGLPGLWLMVGSVGLYAWLTHLNFAGWTTIWILVGLALCAEIVEFVAGSAGAKAAGGSKRAAVGAIIGALIGGFVLSIPIPLIGTVIGVCLGAFAGAAVVEMMIHRDVGHSMRVGAGAAKGRFYGIVSKLAFGIVILIIAMIAAFPIRGAAPVSPTPVLPAPTTGSS